MGCFENDRVNGEPALTDARAKPISRLAAKAGI